MASLEWMSTNTSVAAPPTESDSASAGRQPVPPKGAVRRPWRLPILDWFGIVGTFCAGAQGAQQHKVHRLLGPLWAGGNGMMSRLRPGGRGDMVTAGLAASQSTTTCGVWPPHRHEAIGAMIEAQSDHSAINVHGCDKLSGHLQCTTSPELKMCVGIYQCIE